jgi:hypothetical protein
MPGVTTAIIQKNLELRSTALEVNKEELPHLEGTRQKVDEMLAEMRDLSVKQASLTAAKQEVTKRLKVLTNEGGKLLTFVDAGIRQHYGNRSEKLLEFGQRPFRSQPRLKLIGLDGQPVKPGAPSTESSELPPTE